MDPSPLNMQNPFEEQQTALLSRMMGNLEKLSEAMAELMSSLEQITHYNAKSSDLNQAIQHYALNVKYNLQNQDGGTGGEGGIDPPV